MPNLSLAETRTVPVASWVQRNCSPHGQWLPRCASMHASPAYANRIVFTIPRLSRLPITILAPISCLSSFHPYSSFDLGPVLHSNCWGKEDLRHWAVSVDKFLRNRSACERRSTSCHTLFEICKMFCISISNHEQINTLEEGGKAYSASSIL